MANDIQGLQETQDGILRTMAALRPDSDFGRVIQYVTIGLHRGDVVRAHVDTGTMRAGQLLEVNGLSGRVYTNPSAHNPRTGARAAMYEQFEDRRGGDHAAKRNTFEQDAPRVVQEAISQFIAGLP